MTNRGHDNQTLMVASIQRVADTVIAIELRGAVQLPPFTAGAHIPLYLSNGLIKSYSLTNSQDERERYVIAVGRDAKSRGGSLFIHDRLRVGDSVVVGSPRNNFPFVEEANCSVFIAGGIGITPYLSMIRRALQLGHPWELHYCARSRRNAAFLDDIDQMARVGGRLTTHFDDETRGRLIDLRQVISSASSTAHIYCCGPAPMLAAFKEVTADRAPDMIHFEYFTQSDEPAMMGGFMVRLARQNREIYISQGQTILDALIAEHIDVQWACREGVCGTCEARVLEGVPLHRDSVLTQAERDSNRTMMTCCSGSQTPYITLDI
jgi:ferredoxin-NADP reductase